MLAAEIFLVVVKVGEGYDFVALVAIDLGLFLGLKADFAHWCRYEHLILVLVLLVLLLIAWNIVFFVYFRLEIERKIVAVGIHVSFSVS